MSTLASETRLISVGTVLSTLILGPIVEFVYAWAVYRQAMLDVPQQEGFPNEVAWPNKP